MVTVLYYEQQRVWILGIFVIISAMGQLFIICLIGTIINVKNDKIISNISAIPWYSMNNCELKNLCLILKMAQKPALITFGGLMEINMMAFVSVSNKIYSYFMVLNGMNEV